MRVTLLHNPRAGVAHPSADELCALMRGAGHAVAYHSTRRSDMDRALRDPGDLVAVAGGDGTVAKVAALLAGRGVPLAILPLGTANNVARALGTAGEAEALVAGWPHARRARLDVGHARGAWGAARFVEAAGVGLMARLLATAEAEGSKGEAGGREEEVAAGQRLLRNVLRNVPARPGRLVLDDTEVTGAFILAVAMNIDAIGSRVVLAPGADPTDGLLDVVWATEEHRGAIADYLDASLDGQPATLALPTRRSRSLRVETHDPAVHVDDDHRDGGRGDLVATVDGVFVEVLLPEGVSRD